MSIFLKLEIADRFSVRKSSDPQRICVTKQGKVHKKSWKQAAMEEKIVAYSKLLHLNFIYQEISRTDTARV